MGYMPGTQELTPEQFKKSGDVDDTASFLRAFDYFHNAGVGRQAGGTLFLRGGYTISDTLLISSIGCTLRGSGWGNTTSPTSGTWIRWNGPAGRSMIKFLQIFNGGLDNIRLVGNSAARPLCGVEWADQGTDSFAWCYMNRVWIGHYLGYDSDNAVQMDNGIIASGTLNGDSNTFSHVSISNVANVGFDIQNQNFACVHCNGLFINYAQIGLKIYGGEITGTNWFFGAISDTCFRLLDGSEVQVTDFQSEQGTRLATWDDANQSGKFILRTGAYQINNTMAADGRLIDTGNAQGWNIHLDDFQLQIVGGYTGPPPKIRAYHRDGSISSGTLRMVGVRGIVPDTLELGSWIWTTDSRDIVYQPAVVTTQDAQPSQHWHGDYTDPVDRTFRVFASDQTGEHRLRGGPFIVRRLATPDSPAATASIGSGATTYSYKVTALTYDGESVPSAAVTCTNGTPLAAGAKVNNIRWSSVQGAYAYRVYGRTAGSELLLKTVTWNELHPILTGAVTPPSWNDDGSLTPAGAQPAVNNTGNLTVEGRATLTNGIAIDSGTRTATAAAGTATLNKYSGVITTAALTTAAATDYVLTLTNSTIAAGDMVFVSVDNGTNTTEGLAVNRVTPSANTAVIRIRNTHATVALNGTIKISFMVMK